MYVDVEVGGMKAILWDRRQDAIGAANVLTSRSNRQHTAVRAGSCWAVKDVVTEQLHDKNGPLPMDVSKILLEEAASKKRRR